MLTFIFSSENTDTQTKITEIFERFYPMMLYIAKSILHDPYLAEDAVSEAFIKLMKYPEKIDLENNDKTERFVYIVTKSASIDILRAKAHEKIVLIENFNDYMNIENLIFDNISLQEINEEIAACISKLNKTYSEILYLKLELDLSNEEIGKILGIRRENVRVRLSRARKALREQIKKEGFIAPD